MIARPWEVGVVDEPHVRLLHRSARFTIAHEFESVILCGDPLDAPVCIGDFYGDPVAAAVDVGEQWCVIVGCGFIAYLLNPPWSPYAYPPGVTNGQWWEFGRDDGENLWLASVRASGPAKFVASGEAGEISIDCTLKVVRPGRPR